MNIKILSDFEQKRVIFIEYEQKIKELITSLVKENSIEIHAIDSRVKEKESLQKKIERKDGKYSSLDDITDTVGLRIITYFEDDVDKLADILKQQFYLDELNSIDKRKRNNPEDFGYSSLHFVLKLMEPRASLPEYERFKEINFEIQIRSILQHAWAEIEHDLGYKNENEIPFEIRRDFSRIAGLLELADMEFLRIKKFLQRYSVQVEQNIESNNLNIAIDKVTLKEYMKNSDIISNINGWIASFHGDIIIKNSISNDNANVLHFFDIKTIYELDEHLNDNSEKILKFYKKWTKVDRTEVNLDTPLFYLYYVLAYESKDEGTLVNYLPLSTIGKGFYEQIITDFSNLKKENFKL